MELRMMVTSTTKNENATKPLPSPLSKIPLNYGGDGEGRLNLIPLPLSMGKEDSSLFPSPLTGEEDSTLITLSLDGGGRLNLIPLPLDGGGWGWG